MTKRKDLHAALKRRSTQIEPTESLSAACEAAPPRNRIMRPVLAVFEVEGVEFVGAAIAEYEDAVVRSKAEPTIPVKHGR